MKDTTWLTTYKIAHRGLHTDSLPENSLGAFAHAITHGLAIELDVQPSLEGVPVVFHDDHLKRLTGIDDYVYHYVAETLQKTPLKGSEYTIPTLDETLAFIDGQVPVLIEIKADAPVISLTNAVLERLETYAGPVAVHSFSPKVIRHIKHQAPDVLRGQISSDFKDTQKLSKWRKFYLSRMLLNPLSQPDFITYDIKALPHPSVARFKAKKKPVLGYTAQNKKAYEEALNHVDNVVFEHFLVEVE